MGPGRARSGSCARLTLLAAAVVSCAPSPPSNILFIVVDTLRADHLGCYGYARPTSPHIDAFARRAVRFERAYATAPWTKPSVASMITGLHPAALGIDNIFSQLPQSADTLAEILGRNGYRTAGVVSHVLLAAKWRTGFEQGYDVYLEDAARGYEYASTEAVTEEAIGLLGDLADSGQPFLLFVHYFDPHFNYLDHAAFDFAPDHSERLDGDESMAKLRKLMSELGPADLALIRDLYDEEIRATDAGVGRLLTALADRSLARSTVVVFTSDHGEELGEKGWLGHSRTLDEIVVRVPLIIRDPAAQPAFEVISEPVSLVSLTPTILELLGVAQDDFAFHGASFARHLRGGPADGADAIFFETDVPSGAPRLAGEPEQLLKRGLVGERFKLVADDVSGTLEIYDLAEDPEELRNLASNRPDLKAQLLPRLRAHVRRIRSESKGKRAAEPTPADLEILRKLGYVEPAVEAPTSDPQPGERP